MERSVAWNDYSEQDKVQLNALAADYIDFISENKTERECVDAAIKAAEISGYMPLQQAI